MKSPKKRRQIGFIRINSLRKIYNKAQEQKNIQKSSDSFSSFQYSNNEEDQVNNQHINSKNLKAQLNKKNPYKKYLETMINEKVKPKDRLVKNYSCQGVYNQQAKQQQLITQVQFKNKNFKHSSFNKNELKQRRNIKQQLKDVQRICDKISKMNFSGRFIFDKKKQFIKMITQKTVNCQTQLNKQPERVKNQLLQEQALQMLEEQNLNVSSSFFCQNNQKCEEQKINSSRQDLKQSIYVINKGKECQQFQKKQIYRRFKLDYNQNEQELIQNYNKQVLLNKNTSLNNKKQLQKLYQTQGGISFNINTKQFYNIYQNKLRKMPTKSNFVNKRQQILKRRQTAKNYSKQARFKIFGFF